MPVGEAAMPTIGRASTRVDMSPNSFAVPLPYTLPFAVATQKFPACESGIVGRVGSRPVAPETGGPFMKSNVTQIRSPSTTTAIATRL